MVPLLQLHDMVNDLIHLWLFEAFSIEYFYFVVSVLNDNNGELCGTHKADWKDCVDVSTEYKDFCKKNPLVKECNPNPNDKERNNGEKTKVVHETTVIQSATATATANTNAAADVSNCRLDGSEN